MFRNHFIHIGLILQLVLILGFEHHKFQQKPKSDCLTKVTSLKILKKSKIYFKSIKS